MGTPENRITGNGNGHRWPGVGYPAGTKSEDIEQDIARTRAEMDETLCQLDEALHPRHLLDDLLKFIRRQDIFGEDLKAAGGRIGHQFKQHPMPTALVGAGIAWLLFDYKYGSPIAYFKQARAKGKFGSFDNEGMSFMNTVEDVNAFQSETAACEIPVVGDKYESSSEGKVREALKAAGEKASQKAARVGRSVRGVAQGGRRAAHEAREWLGDAGHRAGSVAGKLGHSISDSISTATSRGWQMVGQVGDSAAVSMSRAKERVSQTADEHPIAMAFGLLSVGLLAGLLLPRTRREDELVGDVSDDLKHRTRDHVRRAAGEAKVVARSLSATVKDAAWDAVEEAGLSPSQLKEKAKDVASNVSRAAKYELEEHGLTPEQIKSKIAGRTGSQGSEEGMGGQGGKLGGESAEDISAGIEQLKENFERGSSCECEHERRGGLDV